MESKLDLCNEKFHRKIANAMVALYEVRPFAISNSNIHILDNAFFELRRWSQEILDEEAQSLPTSMEEKAYE